MLLLLEVSFSVINNLGTLSSELQINFGALQIETEKQSSIRMIGMELQLHNCVSSEVASAFRDKQFEIIKLF